MVAGDILCLRAFLFLELAFFLELDARFRSVLPKVHLDLADVAEVDQLSGLGVLLQVEVGARGAVVLGALALLQVRVVDVHPGVVGPRQQHPVVLRLRVDGRQDEAQGGAGGDGVVKGDLGALEVVEVLPHVEGVGRGRAAFGRGGWLEWKN